jgi:pilus assembly protein Flp/PilA
MRTRVQIEAKRVEGVLHMKTLFRRFIRDESGATAIEYGLIAAGISVAIITVVASVGSSLNTTSSRRRSNSR